MNIEFTAHELELRDPFRITRGMRTHAHTLTLTVSHDGIDGYGETSPNARYGESVQNVERWLSAHTFAEHDPFDFAEVVAGTSPAIRCALDIALHDWQAQRLGVPLWRSLGLDPARTLVTSYTLGIDDIDVMVRKLDAVRDAPIIKVKLGAGRDIEIMEALRSRYSGMLRIDANEGWTAEQAVDLLREMERLDIELCEQPIPAGKPEQLRWISERTSIPIVADEDAIDARSLLMLRGCVAGVNVKLVKTGGIRGALEMIRCARALDLRVMIGCMLETSILATAAATLTPFADWADIDGPLLLHDDPFCGVTYEDSKLVLSNLPGLGIRAKTPS